MIRRPIVGCVAMFVVVISVVAPSVAGAGGDVITFDSDMGVDGYTPVDDAAIHDAFRASHGVVFSLEGAAAPYPFLEDQGGQRPSGFSRALASGEVCPQGTYLNGKECHDTPAPGYEAQLGDFFIRMDAAGGAQLVIDYVVPVSQASFEIWDLDSHPTLGSEQWCVEVFNDAGEFVSEIITPDGLSVFLDGEPYLVQLVEPYAVIARIRVSFCGSKKRGLGLAFNNFTPASAGVPVYEIDWKPGSNPSAVNLQAQGAVPMALIGQSDLDVRQVDYSSLFVNGEPASVRVRGKDRYQVSFKDLNGDGITDAVIQFETEGLALTPGDAWLFGYINDGTEFYGYQDGDLDPVKIAH